MVGNNENVLVEFDYQNIVLVDPNKTIDSDGNVKERLLKHENLTYYANLECSLFPRTRLSQSSSGNVDVKTISIAKVNFLKPGNKTFLGNEYLDELTGLGSVQGDGINQVSEKLNTVTKKNEVTKKDETESYYTQSVVNNIDTELLGITSIDIDTNLSLFPEVTIEMIDVRGRALFEKGESSPYSVFFNYPYPLFFLTIKGYLGKAVKYQLALRTFNARYDGATGNFRITVKFYAYKFNVLSNVYMKYIMAVPYMYHSKFQTTTKSPAGITAANSTNNGSDKTNVVTKDITKGYQKIKEVYSEYKNKGLIVSDFPEITLIDLVKRLEQLETYIADTFTKADLQPLSDGDNYRENLQELAKNVYWYRNESWFARYLDTKNFYVSNDGRRIYTFKTEIINKNAAISELGSIFDTWNKLLDENPTFGKNGSYKLAGNKTTSSIDNKLTPQLIYINATKNIVNLDESFYQRTGKTDKNSDEYKKFVNDLQTIFNSVSTDENNKITYQWFVFEGEGSFESQVQIMLNNLNTEIEKIKTEMGKILSSRLQDKSKLGFKPTIKNIIAVLLASAEGFLRLMDDVHVQAWDKRGDKSRVDAILSKDKSAEGTDTKDSVSKDGVNLIPVYPWPQYFLETNDDKGEKFVLTYPGDPKVITKTKAYQYDVWPEVEFVEEFLKGVTQINNPASLDISENVAQDINRVTTNAIDFPTTNILFSNKQESKFLYEIWERVFLAANYQKWMRPGAKDSQIPDVVAEAEFINIKESLGVDTPYLIQKLKQFGLTPGNIIPTLAHVSNNGIGESWQKYIRDEFVTKYIQQEVNNSFVILDKTVLAPGVNVVKQKPSNLSYVEKYLQGTSSNETDFTDTFPFNLDKWGQSNLADGSSTNKFNSYNTTKVYALNEDKKMVANFTPKTGKQEIRPITNFNFYNSNISNPSPTSVIELDTFYSTRKNDTQLITEGNLVYRPESVNVNNGVQTTSMLNTPYFVNAIQEGVQRFVTGNTYPYVSASFLLLNSLPLATLREKYKTYNGTATTDLDYIFATLKKFGALHRVPYAWVLKYGSIWHRYKVWNESGVDILNNSCTDFGAIKNFDPITNVSSKVYNLTINNSAQTVSLQKTTIVGTDTNTEMNLGFYPKVINDFNIFYRGLELFSGYTDTDIQNKLNDDGFSMTLNDSSIITKNLGYDPNDATNTLIVKPWSVVINDKTTDKNYIVPSFGSNINQVSAECFGTDGKLKQGVRFSSPVFNGSVRGFWALPNYGYYDNVQVDIPTPYEYMKIIQSGSSQQESFSIRASSLSSQYSNGYTSIEESLTTFNKEILDLMEEEFLNFSKSMYEYKTIEKDSSIITKVQIDKLFLENDGVYKNFQLLMREIMSVSKTTTSNSESFTTEIQNKQLSNLVSTLQNFLEFDVVLKYGNPSNFNRKLFDSYGTVNFIEDKITYDIYVPDSLPTSGGTTTMAMSIASRPQPWKDMYNYVGYSTIPGIQYSNNGSTLTDFFVDMNIEFTSDSVKQLATLVKIYGTQKYLDPTMNRVKFTNLINQYILDNKSFTDLTLNSLFTKIQTGLPNIVDVTEKTTDTAVDGEQIKIETYETFKALNDTWISGYDYKETTFFEDVMFMDRANRNIGDDILIDPFKVRKLLKDIKEINPMSSVYHYMASILEMHHFICMMHPAYINFYNVQEVQQNNVPKIDGSLEFGNSLFGTYLNVDARNSSPKLVCMYAAEPSKHPDTGKNETYRFKSDAFDLRRSSDNPLIDKLEGKKDWGLSNRVVGFNVDIGITNQNVFSEFGVSQDLGKQTSESILNLDSQINQYNGKTIATQNASLWSFYKNRSYQCNVTTLGNAMIQPTMYFNLRHVPMFNGPYYIMDVKHKISPGKFDTTFTGIRQQIFALPKLDSYIQTLTQTLVSEIIKEIREKKTTESISDTGTNQNSNNVTGINNQVSSKKGSDNIGNPQNCTDDLIENKYLSGNNQVKVNFVEAKQSQTNLTPQEVANSIKTNVVSGNNRTNKYLAFITMYIESFENNQFVTWNNNYAGVKLNYVWPGDLRNYFNQDYLCRQKDGDFVPYATFDNIDNVSKLLDNYWSKYSGVSVSAENLAKLWITKWNKKKMSNSDFESFKKNNDESYKDIVKMVQEGIVLADILKL
jgi:hypothetical protein